MKPGIEVIRNVTSEHSESGIKSNFKLIKFKFGGGYAVMFEHNWASDDPYFVMNAESIQSRINNSGEENAKVSKLALRLLNKLETYGKID